MSSPINAKSLDAATGADVDGRSVRSMGHFHTGIFVNDAAGGTFEVVLEASPDGEHWGTVVNGNGENIVVSDADLNDDGNVYRHVAGTYAEYLRARLRNHNGDGEITAWVMAGGNTGQGRKGTQRKGAVER